MKNWKPSLFYIIKKRLQKKNFLYEFYFVNKKVLDIGCGEGEFLKACPDKSKLFGVDMNERAIAELAKKGFAVGVASVDKLPFQDSSFDAVHCRNVIEHLDISTAYNMLKEVERVLRPGGIFVLASEIVTNKFWTTFGHVKPYPPEAIIKLLRHDSRESFEGINELEYSGLFYLGDYYQNKLLYLFSVMIAYFTPWFRREYFLILRKKK